MKRKVLFVIPTLMTGGAERQLAILVRGIAKELFEPHVAVFCSGGQFWEELRDFPKCHLFSLERKGRWDFTVVWKLARYIQEQKIELIQGWMPPANTFATLAGMFTGRPALMGVRASNMDYPTWGGKFYVWTDKLFGRFAQAIVCNSTCGAEFHCQMGYSSQKLLVIHNGVQVPDDQYFPEPFQHSPPWNIGMLARFDPMKDHSNMLSALKMLKESGINVILHLFGDGPEEYTKQLKSLAIKLGVFELIFWHGKQYNSWKALSEVDLLVSSSCYGEGMSNSILEAMAAGRPVITTNVGDSNLLVGGEGRPSGIVVPPRDSRALADAIREVIASTEKVKTYTHNAKIRIREQYSAAQMVQQYQALYKSVLGKKFKG